MRTTNGTDYAYSLVEQETICRYDQVDRLWYVWTCIPRHIAEFKRQGWTLLKETQDGAEFKAPAFALKPGKAQKRELSQEQKEALARRLKTHRTQGDSAA